MSRQFDPAKEPVDWASIEKGLMLWLTDFEEIVPEAIFEDQNVPQPTYPYGSVNYVALVKEGGKDEQRITFDDSQELGQEVGLITTGPVRLTLAINFHVDRQHGGNKPASTAMALALQAQSSLGKDSVLQHLADYGIAVVREQGVTNTSVVVNGAWLSRATLDLVIRITPAVTERTGYIEKVELVNDDHNIDFTVDASE